jgi:hypothetical protein
MLTQRTLKTDGPITSLCWKEDYLIDWAGGGKRFFLDGNIQQSSRRYAYRFDSAIQAPNSPYAIIYEKRGTKGLILKDGEIFREINRSYYQAQAYEYPICFLQLPNDGLAIIHCPESYDRIDIELVESGKLLTNFTGRKPEDCFHSRLQISPCQNYFLNTGWVWHPFGIFEVYNISNVLADPQLLDRAPRMDVYEEEIASATFLDDDYIFLTTSSYYGEEPEEEVNEDVLQIYELGLYSIKDNQLVRKIRLSSNAGNIMAINEQYVLSLYKYPKVIDTFTGEVVQSFPPIKSGHELSSYGYNYDQEPSIAIDHINKRVAIAQENSIEILAL